MFLSALLFGLWSPWSIASDTKTSIREGAEAFRSGDFARAAESFARAEQSVPDDLRIAFNHGISLSAAGKWEEASTVFRKTALAADPQVAARSLVLLGEIAVHRAKEQLADPPESTPPPQRKEVLDQLMVAERYFMESQEIEPAHDSSAGNILEQIRLWRDRIEGQWNVHDRKAKRQADWAARFGWLENWEDEIGNAIAQTLEEENSPKKYQTYYDQADQQRQFTEECESFQGDLRQQLLKQEPSSERGDRPEEFLIQELDRIRDSADGVGRSLRELRGKESLDAARATVDSIYRLRVQLLPYEMIVQESEREQSRLGRVHSDDPVSFQVDRQERVARCIPLMVFRAKEGLEQLKNANHEIAPAGASANDPQSTEPRKKSMELAVKYGDELELLTENAVKQLQNHAPEKALPDQTRALELLREILEPLRNQQPQNQQNQQDHQGQGEQQDKSEQDSAPEQKSQDEQQQNQSDGKQDEKDGKSEQEKSESELTRAEMEKEMEKTEQLLRLVRRKQQEANEKRRQIRALLMQSEPVEKDW